MPPQDFMHRSHVPEQPQQLPSAPSIHHSVETVAIKAKTATGYVLINASDFDSSKHKRFDGKEADRAMATSGSPPPSTVESRPTLVERGGWDATAVVTPEVSRALTQKGYGTATAIHIATVEQLTDVKGVGTAIASALKREAAKFVSVAGGQGSADEGGG